MLFTLLSMLAKLLSSFLCWAARVKRDLFRGVLARAGTHQGTQIFFCHNIKGLNQV